MGDPFGHAIRDYFTTGIDAEIVVNSNYTEDERIPASYFFRTEVEMPEPEIAALKNCRGKVLDVGAAAGCHAIILQERGFDLTAVEKSPLAAWVLNSRGIRNVVCADIFQFTGNSFDTILLLMNGAGIGGTVDGLKKLLLHLKSLLNPNGRIFIDSSDIRYLFEEEDGSVWMDLANPAYYGEMEYEVFYKNEKDSFKWLFIDFKLLSKVAGEAGYSCKKIEKGDHFDYLAQLQIEK
jgi:SAM-dependent methyltransferase